MHKQLVGWLYCVLFLERVLFPSGNPIPTVVFPAVMVVPKELARYGRSSTRARTLDLFGTGVQSFLGSPTQVFRLDGPMHSVIVLSQACVQRLQAVLAREHETLLVRRSLAR